jgi:hypothetical protein
MGLANFAIILRALNMLYADGVSLKKSGVYTTGVWQDDLWTYMQEVPPAFHTGGDYQAAVRLVGLHYPKLKDSLKDWSLN